MRYRIDLWPEFKFGAGLCMKYILNGGQLTSSGLWICWSCASVHLVFSCTLDQPSGTVFNFALENSVRAAALELCRVLIKIFRFVHICTKNFIALLHDPGSCIIELCSVLKWNSEKVCNSNLGILCQNMLKTDFQCIKRCFYLHLSDSKGS